MSTLAQTDTPLSRYISYVRAIPELSREEEVHLARRWVKRREPAAAEMLIRANLRHVASIASNYRRYGLPFADLIAEGNFGLVHAVSKFDPERGTRFVTYAGYWMRAFILNYVIRSWSMVGVGSGPFRSKLFFRLRRERARVVNLVGEGDAAEKMLAERMGETQERVVALINRLDARDVSLDAKVFQDGNAAMVDTLEADQLSQDDAMANRQLGDLLRSSVREALSQLDPRERFIVQVRMMADSDDALSLAEIGRRLGVSRERARQIEARAKRKLRSSLGQMQAEGGRAA